MRIIDKSIERQAAIEADNEKKRKWWDKVRADMEAAKESTTFAVSGTVWARFADLFQTGAIRHTYPELSCVLFPHTALTVANRFLALAIRDRKNLKSLVINDAPPLGGDTDRLLDLPTDPGLIETLEREARKVGIGYEDYLRAIFGSTVDAILEEHRKREEERRQREDYMQPVHVEGCIPADVRHKLERKFGRPNYDPMSGVRTYLDMLIDLAKEVL